MIYTERIKTFTQKWKNLFKIFGNEHTINSELQQVRVLFVLIFNSERYNKLKNLSVKMLIIAKPYLKT